MPLKSTFDFKKFSEELIPWEEKNFGSLISIAKNVKYSHQPLLGIIEELGEMSEAMEQLQMLQRSGILSNVDTKPQQTYETIRDLIADAVGDIMIYMGDYCNCVDISLDTLLGNVNFGRIGSIHIMKIAGKLAHEHLKMEQGIRGSKEEHLDNIKGMLQNIYTVVLTECWNHNLDFDVVLQSVWAKVRSRDWNKDRVNGGEEITKAV